MTSLTESRIDREKESFLYGVDYSGRVWCLIHSRHQNNFHWTTLPATNKIDIKRLTSAAGIIWAISSDHQIYVFVPKRDVPIRVREELYENQRWNPVGGFCDQLLPTDRPPFSDETGLIDRDKSLIELPSSSWIWEGDWLIENTFDNQLLSQDGWTYAIDFPATYKPEKGWNSMVRRRKLFRYRRYNAFNRWNKIESIHEDHTKEPFVDVAASEFGGNNTSSSVCLWAVSILGQVYFRMDVNKNNPEGFRWIQVDIVKEACQVSISSQGVPFVVTWAGSFLFRIGITPQNLMGTDWIEITGPSNGLFQISVGENMMWALTRDKKCWTMKGSVQELIKSTSTQVEWLEIPGTMKCISVSKNDQNVLAVSEDEGILMIREGIAEDQLHGRRWRVALPPDISWDTLSVSSRSSDVSDSLDGGSGDASSNITTYSIRPDLPSNQATFNTSAGSDAGESVNLCWIDGTCSSMLRSLNDGDLEVGPWREEILNNLQTLKVSNEKFDFPNAVEPSTSSWTKSTNAKMTYKSKKKPPVSGQIEISNNDTLVFHKGMQNSWICSMKDILSVILDTEACVTFSLRIRNSFEEGKAEIVSLRFSNELEAEEWRKAIADLSIKSQEECSVANLWVTTEAGEVHQGGQIKIADTPGEMDIITPNPGESLKCHHPLVKGFFPGSELKLDITIPSDAQRFAFNFKGGDSTAFHFNPRFDASQVVRNTFDKGEWLEEERDGVFPFQKGESYSILFQCTDTHFVAIVTRKKYKYVFAYKHKILPRLITIFTAVGDVNVSSIRYDPSNPEESVNRLEFISTPVSGHFWKVAAAGDGHFLRYVWALAYDMTVWAYLFNPRKSAKVEGQNAQMKEVNDHKVFFTYENQRWNPISGFTSHGLPTDRQAWTDETGRVKLEKDGIKLPSNKWTWDSDWEIDFDLKEGVDKDGWQYAIDFPASYHSSRKFNDFVRRRRWKRVCKFSSTGPWELVPNIKLIDICIWMNEDCDWEVLGLCENGDVVVRKGITPENILGDRFEAIPTEKAMVSISAWYQQKIWTIGKDGFAYIRYRDHWQLLDRPSSSPLKKITVGPNSVWALGTNKTLFRRTDIQPVFPEGRDWSKVCDSVYDISVSGDGTLWAIIKSGDNVYQRSLATRMGITENNPNGLGWEIVAAGPWLGFSATGVFSRNSSSVS